MTYLMQSYDDSLKHILNNGVKSSNRTGVDTISIHGMQNRYDLSEGYYPLLTKRKIWPKAVLAELLWFLSGSTNNNDLENLGAKFWRPWVNEEFEVKNGLESGDLGAIYGFQLRFFGGDYKKVRYYQSEINRLLKRYKTETAKEQELLFDNQGLMDHHCVMPSTGIASQIKKNSNELEKVAGFDQLEYIQNEVKHNPSSRRILFSLWNMNDFELQALAPCHFTYQVLINGNSELTGILTQRSADFWLGVPANIQFYSTLTLMLADIGGFKAKEFIHNTNDSHIYENQIDAVKEYLSRDKIESPKIEINKHPVILEKNFINYYTTGKITYTIDDFNIIDYKPLDPIKVEPVV